MKANEPTPTGNTNGIDYPATSLSKANIGSYSWEKKPRGMRNSEFLFYKKYKDELECFSNKGHPFNYNFKASEKKENCA